MYLDAQRARRRRFLRRLFYVFGPDPIRPSHGRVFARYFLPTSPYWPKLAKSGSGDTVIRSQRRSSTLITYPAVVEIGGRIGEASVAAKTMIEARSSIKTALTKV